MQMRKSTLALAFLVGTSACDGSLAEGQDEALRPPVTLRSAAMREDGAVLDLENVSSRQIEALRGSADCLDRFRQRRTYGAHWGWEFEWDRQPLERGRPYRIGPFPPPAGWECAETRIHVMDVRFTDGTTWSGFVSTPIGG